MIKVPKKALCSVKSKCVFPGSRLIIAIEQASGVAVVDVKELESDVRSFTNAVYDWERKSEKSKSGSNLREDTFRNFELESLGLLRKLKKNSCDEKNEKSKASEPKQTRKVKAQFVNPRKNLKKEKFSCPHCSKTYVSLKSLQNHVRIDHKEENKVYAHDFQHGEPLIQCMLLKKNKNPCTFKSIVSQMGRHCESKSLHIKVNKRPPGFRFRGWRFFPKK